MKTRLTELKWGLFFVVMTLAWMVLEKFSGLHSSHIHLHPYLTNLFAIPATLIYVYALKEKKNKDYKDNMSYKQGLISGLIITVVVTVISPLTQIITSQVITPEYFPNVIAVVVKEGKMTIGEAEAYFTLNNYIKQSLIAASAMGIITSAIVAIFLRTKD